MGDCSGIGDGCYKNCPIVYVECCEKHDHACKHENCQREENMTNQECADILAHRGWTAEVITKTGRWEVGPQTSEGILDVWGEGDSLEEAIGNALDCIESSLVEHGIGSKR